MLILSLLSTSLVLAFVSASDPVCLTRFGPLKAGHGRQIPTRTTTVTVSEETPGFGHWRRDKNIAQLSGTCASWTAVATSVSTVYTGTWNRNATVIATATSKPSSGTWNHDVSATARPSNLQKRRSPFNVHFRHHVGQPIDHMMPNAYLVECFVTKTTSTLSTASSRAQGSQESHRSLTLDVSTSAATTSTVCSPKPFTKTSVTTQDIRCAPTNLVTTVEPGRAIGSVEFWNPALVYLESASDCCQLCMQMDGCSSIQAAVDAKNCWLIFGTSRCGLAQIVHQDPNPNARIGGIVVQEGCGTIEYTTEP